MISETVKNLAQLEKTLAGDEPFDRKAAAKTVKTAQSTISSLRRHNFNQKTRHKVEKDIMQAELANEQVDRSANAIRIADREKQLYERSVHQNVSVLDTAVVSAGFIENSLSSLCPHTHSKADGSREVERAMTMRETQSR